MYDDYVDEDVRRQRREEQPPANSSPVDGRPWWQRSGLMGDNGIGSPESGYGEGGVDNPAYQHDWTMDDVNRLAGEEAKPPDFPAPPTPPPSPSPGPRPEQPAFQPATPSSYLPPTSPQAPAPQVKQPGVTDEVTKILMARLNELKQPQDLNNDPAYQQAIRAHQIGQLRSAEMQRKALAERSAAGGTRASGGFNVGVRGIAERAGENAAQYRSGLARDRQHQREAQLVEAIKIARAIGQDDIANQLELQRLELQGELGRGDIALREKLGFGQLGLSYADLIQRANRDAVLAVL